ncbi:hypothetical protein VTK56DRAFT_48 [Thermocarpiscus australiensis]
MSQRSANMSLLGNCTPYPNWSSISSERKAAALKTIAVVHREPGSWSSIPFHRPAELSCVALCGQTRSANHPTSSAPVPRTST